MKLTILIDISPRVERLLLDGQREVLEAFTKMETRMAQRIENLRTEVAAYVAKVDAYILTVDQAVAKAVAADDAEEEGVIATLSAEIAAAKEKVPTAPEVPPEV